MKTKNQKYVESELIRFFRCAGCDNPSNIGDIVDYIIDDAEETTSDPESFKIEGISCAEISTGFRRFIESINS
jgi:hypothetical protein